MSPDRRLLVPLAVLTLVSLAGEYVCRAFARGANQQQLFAQAAENLVHVPDVLGTWRGTDGEGLAENIQRTLGCRAYLSRMYIDNETGDQVGLLLLAGESGPLVAHTPDICFPSSNFEAEGEPVAEKVRGSDQRESEFYRLSFFKKAVGGQKVQVYYGWRRFDGPWQAPRNPRFALGGEPMLYKLQLSADLAPLADSAGDSSPLHRFLSALLPHIDKQLAAKP